MTKISLAVGIVVLALTASPTRADGFRGGAYGSGPLVKKGTLLDCDLLPLLNPKVSPATHEWATQKGFLEVSKVTQTPNWSPKVKTKDAVGRPALQVGCWVAQEIVKEKVNGEERAYAKAMYRVTDMVRGSPIADAPVCVKKQRLARTMGAGDYRIVFEGYGSGCVTDQWTERIDSLAKLEGREELFLLAPAQGRKGYVVLLGF